MRRKTGQHAPRPQPRSYGELPLLAVLLVVGLGLGTVSRSQVTDSYWRIGSLVVAAGLFVGAVLRLVLPARRAGLLVVRSRAFDVVVLSVLASAVLLLAIVVPSPRL